MGGEHAQSQSHSQPRPGHGTDAGHDQSQEPQAPQPGGSGGAQSLATKLPGGAVGGRLSGNGKRGRGDGGAIPTGVRRDTRMKGAAPRRGEMWLVNFNPGRGSEQKGVRPALVLQNDVGNVHGATTIVAAISTTIKEFPVAGVVPVGGGGLKHRSMVNLAQVLTVDKERFEKRLGNLSRPTMQRVNEAI